MEIAGAGSGAGGAGAGAGAGSGSGSGGEPAGGAGGAGGNKEPTQVLPNGKGGSNGQQGAGAQGAGKDDDQGGEPGKKPEKKPAGSKHKLKRLGNEVELELEDVLRLASDDGEHELTGPDGKPAKLRYPELLHNASLGLGALTKMREAADERKKFGEMLNYGKKNVAWMLEHQLGVQDHRKWAAEIIEQELAYEALLQSNPSEYHRITRERAAAEAQQKDGFERSRRATEERRAKETAVQKEMEAKADASLKAVGLPVNDMVRQIAADLFLQYRKVGHELPLEQLAAMTRRDFLKEIHGWFDGMPDEQVLEFLGEGRRKRLRDLELAGLGGGGGKKKDPAEEALEREPKPKPKPKTDDGAGMTSREWLKKFDKA